jgi:hypothetical protein
MRGVPSGLLLWFVGAVLLLAGGQGCDLNPQPLPPQLANSAGSDASTGESSSGGASFTGSSGSSGGSGGEGDATVAVSEVDARAPDAGARDTAMDVADAATDATTDAATDGSDATGQDATDAAADAPMGSMGTGDAADAAGDGP